MGQARENTRTRRPLPHSPTRLHQGQTWLLHAWAGPLSPLTEMGAVQLEGRGVPWR